MVEDDPEHQVQDLAFALFALLACKLRFTGHKLMHEAFNRHIHLEKVAYLHQILVPSATFQQFCYVMIATL